MCIRDRGVTLNELRSNGDWIINGKAAARRFIWRCVICHYLRGTAGEQKMANLPKSHVKPAPPFSYWAMDCFGPWYVREGRRELKRYGTIIHSFGHSCDTHWSSTHHGNIFVLASTTVRYRLKRTDTRALQWPGNQLMGDERIKGELLKHNIDWIRNPAMASNLGSAWERQIRSVRNIMAAFMKQHGHSLDD